MFKRIVLLSAVTVLLIGFDVIDYAYARPCNVAVDVLFRDADGDAVKSDGGPYTEGAALECDGNFLMLSGNRTFVFDIDLISTNPLNAPGNFDVQVGIEGGLLAMATGDTLQSTKVQFNFVVGTTRYFLTFRHPMFPLSDNIPVTRLDNNTWVVEAPADADARLASCRASGKCKLVELGQVKAPFEITITR